MRHYPVILIALSTLAGCLGEPPASNDASMVADTGMDAPDSEDDPEDANSMVPNVPTRYPGGRTLSPITPSVVRAMAEFGPGLQQRNDATFIKVGGSAMAGDAFLRCFATPENVELAEHSDLQATIDHFTRVEIDDRTSFDRASAATAPDVGAGWAVTGAPSPLVQEIGAANPRLALVGFGRHDLLARGTPQEGIQPFFDSMEGIVTELEAADVTPILLGSGPRADSQIATDLAPTYTAVSRAIAEKHQIPFVDMHHAMNALPSQGLADGGTLPNAFDDGGCILTEDALQFGYNVRNLETLRVLDTFRRTALQNAAAPDTPVVWRGTGAPDDPFVIDELPFSHHASTARSPHDLRDAYPACDDGQDESGPEYYYHLELPADTPVRLIVLDGPGVDVDLHLVDDSEESICVERAHRIIERTIAPDTSTVIVDTFVPDGEGPEAGDYSLVVVECEPGDTTCM